jgi:hypothetical protein
LFSGRRRDAAPFNKSNKHDNNIRHFEYRLSDDGRPVLSYQLPFSHRHTCRCPLTDHYSYQTNLQPIQALTGTWTGLKYRTKKSVFASGIGNQNDYIKIWFSDAGIFIFASTI